MSGAVLRDRTALVLGRLVWSGFYQDAEACAKARNVSIAAMVWEDHGRPAWARVDCYLELYGKGVRPARIAWLFARDVSSITQAIDYRLQRQPRVMSMAVTP